ncbi:MAG: hypothetical protein IKD40_07855 [Bacteroidaceae bacterium]|nr:hypothetical protein [Bacteroidaceae bacterium]
MADNLKIAILSLVVFMLPCIASAQFLQRKDSVASVMKRSLETGKDKGYGRQVFKKTDVKEKGGITAEKGKKKGRKTTAKKVKRRSHVKDSVGYDKVQYRLGQRVIMRGDSGKDVKSLANILVKRMFLDEKDIIYTADGGVLYDGEIVRAVKLFQKVSGMYDDGMVGQSTVKALRKRK